MIKKILLFIKQQGRLCRKKKLHFFKFAKHMFSNLKNEYKFSFFDRYLGTKLFVNGYTKNIDEKYFDFNEKLNKVSLDDITIYVPKNTFKPGELAYLYKEVFIPINKNPHAYETKFLKLKTGDVVVDAGACEGFFTLYALQKKVKKVYAFEPFDLFKEGLTKTFEPEIKDNKVSIITKGLSDTTGSTRFSSTQEYICASQFDEQGDEFVETITMDDFIDTYNCEKIDFIKMDIENAELKAIKGAKKTIKKFHPRLSIAVYHDYKNAEEIKKMILEYVPEYKVVFGGCFMYDLPYRPYMVYAYMP